MYETECGELHADLSGALFKGLKRVNKGFMFTRLFSCSGSNIEKLP